MEWTWRVNIWVMYGLAFWFLLTLFGLENNTLDPRLSGLYNNASLAVVGYGIYTQHITTIVYNHGDTEQQTGGVETIHLNGSLKKLVTPSDYQIGYTGTFVTGRSN